MKVRRLGYACINDELNTSKPRVSSSRTIRKATYDKEGLDKVQELSFKNLHDLYKILIWNEDKGIKLFRMSSDIFPWKSEWNWSFLKNWKKAHSFLRGIGDFARKNDHRLTFHPGPFNKLCSPDQRVVNNTIKDLEMHNDILNFMGFEPSYENTINIHVGASYGNKKETTKAFCANYNLLSDSLKKRLTVENDDRDAFYSTQELYDMVHCQIGIPIMFDFHHHRCYPTKHLSEKEAAELAIKTWPKEVTPLFHWSESKREEQKNPKIKLSAHSDYVYGPLPDYELSKPVDLMIEAKKKEKSLNLLKYASGRPVHSHKQVTGP